MESVRIEIVINMAHLRTKKMTIPKEDHMEYMGTDEINDEDLKKIQSALDLISETFEINKVDFYIGLYAAREFVCRLASRRLTKETQKKMLATMELRIHELDEMTMEIRKSKEIKL